MPIDQALPDEAPFGVADWTDFEDNWREKDAEWLQSLGVPRFTTSVERDARLTTPATGRLIYNNETGYLQLRGASAWTDYKPLPLFLTKTVDDANQVLLAHTAAAGKGLSFSGVSPYEVHVNTNFKVQNGVLSVDATGVLLKTGTKTVKLTTSATQLVSDTAINVPSVATLSGALTAVSISGVTTVSATNVNISGTLTGGVINGPSGTVGGVALGTMAVGGANILNAADGLQSNQGMFYGDATSAYLRQRAVNKGALGAAHVRVTSADVYLEGTNTLVNNQLQIRSGRGIQYLNAANTTTWYGGPVIYSATDPGVANVPEGTIWLS
jgi:hypothetical protein